MRLLYRVLALTALSFAGVLNAWAQDMRHVVEPHIPPACTVLKARLAAANGVLPTEAEQDLDTARIQEALDHCAAGHSVNKTACRSGGTAHHQPLQTAKGRLSCDTRTELKR